MHFTSWISKDVAIFEQIVGEFMLCLLSSLEYTVYYLVSFGRSTLLFFRLTNMQNGALCAPLPHRFSSFNICITLAKNTLQKKIREGVQQCN